jgi:hypothetical protein
MRLQQGLELALQRPEAAGLNLVDDVVRVLHVGHVRAHRHLLAGPGHRVVGLQGLVQGPFVVNADVHGR